MGAAIRSSYHVPRLMSILEVSQSRDPLDRELNPTSLLLRPLYLLDSLLSRHSNGFLDLDLSPLSLLGTHLSKWINSKGLEQLHRRQQRTNPSTERSTAGRFLWRWFPRRSRWQVQCCSRWWSRVGEE